MKALGLKWEYHTPWYPSSLGRVKRMNQTLKRQLTKLVLETRLPLALLRIRTAPQKDIRVSPYEMLYGLSYLGWSSDPSSFKAKDQFL
jgi:hypothetical protein